MPLLQKIKNLRLDSIFVEEFQQPSGEHNSKLSIQSSFIQTTTNVQRMNQELDQLRVRIGVVYKKEAAQVTDFGTQRFNEYLLHESQDPNFSFDVPPDGYVSFLQNTLNPSAEPYMSNGAPYSLFAVDPVNQNLLFGHPDGICYVDNGRALPKGVVLYDAPLLEALPTDGDGNIIRHRVVTSTNPGIADSPNRVVVEPGDPRPPIEEGEGVADPIRDEDLNIIAHIEAARTRQATQNLERISLLPLEVKMRKVTSDPLSQLTVYLYVYSTPQVPGSPLSLETGTTPIVSANIIGVKSVWNQTAARTPYVAIGPYENDRYVNAEELRAPQRHLSQIVNRTPLDTQEEDYEFLYDKLYGVFAGTILENRPGIQKVIKNKNFFSELWITRGHKDIPRFTFAFDLQSYLISTSHFSYFYRNSTTATLLLQGSEFYDFVPSEVKDMSLYRRYINRLDRGGINSLGTVGNLRTKGPNSDYPRTYIMPAQPVPNVVGEEPLPSKVSFYEGYDKNIPNQYKEGDAARLGYDVDFVVHDSAPMFLREVVKHLYSLRHEVRDVFDGITLSVPTPAGYVEGTQVFNGRNLYNAKLRRTNVPLDKIIVGHGPDQRSYLTIIKSALDRYQLIIDDILPLENRIVFYDYYRPLLTGDHINPEILLDIERIIDLGIVFFYKKLRSVFPNDPLGRNHLWNAITDFQSRGTCQREYPILSDEHSFDETIDLSTDVGFGADYILSEVDPRIQTEGLTRVSWMQYTERSRSEFDKYFQQLGQDPANLPVGVFAGSAVKHFTPKVFMLPERAVIDQTQYAVQREPLAGYDLDTYASLFVDILRLHYDGDDLFCATPSLQNLGGYENIGLESKNEQLYNSVLSLLDERYGVSMVGDNIPQYIPPQVSEGEYPPTTDVSFYSPLGGSYIVQNGPLALPAIIGGANNTEADIEEYFRGASTTLKGSPPPRTPPKSTPKTPKGQRRIPIKLPFAIFGELSVDKRLDFVVSYEQDQFNSMTGLREIYSITPQNIESILGGEIMDSLPNQYKSMIAVSTTNSQLGIGSGIGPERYDVCRPILEDQDGANNPEQLISYYQQGLNYPPFSLTKDPMKIYAKFLAFWMNYRQVAVVEFLNNFGNLNPGPFGLQLGADMIENPDSEPYDGMFTEKVKLDEWQEMTPDILNTIEQGQQILCRVRVMSPIDFEVLAREVKKDAIQKDLAEAFNNLDIFNLPMYNQYFYYVKGSDEVTFPSIEIPPLPQFPGVIELGPAPATESNSPSPGMGGLVGGGYGFDD